MTTHYRLYHYPLSPFCRKLRLALREKEINFDLIEERYWEKRDDFLALNPAGSVPVLRQEDRVFSDSQAICEYIETVHPDRPFYPEDAIGQYEVRRVVAWFDETFYRDVTSKLLEERVLKQVRRQGEPDGIAVSDGIRNLRQHMQHISCMLEDTGFMVGWRVTLADLTAAAHVSCLDYLNDIDWRREDYGIVKNWYAAMKSRPSFRQILSEYIPGFTGAPHYTVLDF